MKYEPMTKQRIEQYTNIQREIVMLEEQVYRAQVYGDEYVTDVVQNSQRTLVIKGYGSSEIPRLCMRKAKLEAECRDIERFIEKVNDSIMRQILARRYIEGKTIEETAELVGCSDSTTKRWLKYFFEKLTPNDPF